MRKCGRLRYYMVCYAAICARALLTYYSSIILVREDCVVICMLVSVLLRFACYSTLTIVKQDGVVLHCDCNAMWCSVVLLCSNTTLLCCLKGTSVTHGAISCRHLRTFT
jgi:hypothetical protein